MLTLRLPIALMAVFALTMTACNSSTPEANQSAVDPTPAQTVAPSTLSSQPSTPTPIPATTMVTISTTFGDIVIELDEKAAPQTVANFKKLVAEGFYNGTTFHRVIPNFMIQGGDPNSKGQDRSTHGRGGPGYTIPAEIGLKHTRGAVSCARLPDQVNPSRASSGSQFFICVVDTPFLDGQYTVFGRVVEGMEVADKIVAQPRDRNDNPNERIEMTVSFKE
ncbi:MAG: hypothetical protein OHK005_02990 [Candidatus Methylacidiphilales bacterium]